MGPLRAGAARSITSSAVMMAKKKEIGESISGLDGVSSLVSGGDGVSGVRYRIDALLALGERWCIQRMMQ